MIRLLASLESRGFIERTSDLLYGRIVWLQIGGEGQQLLHRSRPRKDMYLTERIWRLSQREWATLRKATEILERPTEDAV